MATVTHERRAARRANSVPGLRAIFVCDRDGVTLLKGALRRSRAATRIAARMRHSVFFFFCNVCCVLLAHSCRTQKHARKRPRCGVDTNDRRRFSSYSRCRIGSRRQIMALSCTPLYFLHHFIQFRGENRPTLCNWKLTKCCFCVFCVFLCVLCFFKTI